MRQGDAIEETHGRIHLRFFFDFCFDFIRARVESRAENWPATSSALFDLRLISSKYLCQLY